MANFRMDGIDGLMRQLSSIGADTDAIAMKAVDAAAPMLESSVRSGAASAASRGYATGATVSGAKAAKAKMNQYGAYSAVTFKGKDSRGMRNAEKAAYLEYGTCKQAARPFMAASVKKTEGQCLSVMEEVFDSEMKKHTD